MNHTWLIFTWFREEKRLLQPVCERLRTGRSRLTFCKTTPITLFYTSERNDGHADPYCRDGNYNPDAFRSTTKPEVWRKWQFVYTGNARVPCWIVRVPKEIIWEHGGLWSDNSVAMLGALFRIQFPLTPEIKAELERRSAVPR